MKKKEEVELFMKNDGTVGTITIKHMCDFCSGDGVVAENPDSECPICHGSGMVKVINTTALPNKQEQGKE